MSSAPMRPGPGDPPEILKSIPFPERTLSNLVRSRALVSPTRPIVEIEETTLTWRDIHELALAVAGRLSSLNVGRGDIVCQMSGNTIGHVATTFGIALLGAIECPVNAGLRGDPLLHVLRDSGARVLLVEQPFLERIEDLRNMPGGLESIVVRGGERLPTVEGAAVVREADLDAIPLTPAEVAPSDPATIMYTSGTTGPAKGVVLPHHFAFSAAAVKVGMWGLGPDDVLFSPLPLYHSNARYSTLLTACILDARAIIVERFSASRFWQQVVDAGATEVGTVGTVAPILFERPPDPLERKHSIRMMHGAGALTLAQREAFEGRFGLRLVTGFSMTETSHFSTTSPEDPGRYRGAGRPVPGFRIEILDEHDSPLEVGSIGEIVVRPEMPFAMFSGYHGNAAATIEAFGNLWFHTGDFGSLDQDGFLHWVDRKKDAIRHKGEMISSRDVEAAALSFPGIVEAAAVGVPADLGEEDVKLFVRAESGAEISFLELLEHCSDALPDFAVPRYFVRLEELPRTSTHKVDKRTLRQADTVADSWDATAVGASE